MIDDGWVQPKLSSRLEGERIICTLTGKLLITLIGYDNIQIKKLARNYVANCDKQIGTRLMSL